MGNLTANPRRFFGAFCSVVNMLSEADGRCATATDSRNMERLEGSDCADTETLQEACTGAQFLTGCTISGEMLKKKFKKTQIETLQIAYMCASWSAG